MLVCRFASGRRSGKRNEEIELVQQMAEPLARLQVRGVECKVRLLSCQSLD